MNALIRGFPPIENPDARVLILGSMPGVASLKAGRYYAHPQNAFWRIMGTLAGAGSDLPYPDRMDRLRDGGIALWDVLECCLRPGSLDSAIVPSSIQVNDFPGFYARHPRLRRICFNGAKAAETYRRHVPAHLTPGVALLRLPSTSPAHAGMSYAEKLRAWDAALAGADPARGAKPVQERL